MSLIKIAAAKWRAIAKNILNKDSSLLNDVEKRFLGTIDTSSRLAGGVNGISRDQLWSISLKKRRALHEWAAERMGLTQKNQDEINKIKSYTLKHKLYPEAVPHIKPYKTPDPKRLP